MALKLTLEQLTDLIKSARLAEPYKDDDPELHTLDGECDYCRMAATKATRILNYYFTEHPEANVFDYKISEK